MNLIVAERGYNPGYVDCQFIRLQTVEEDRTENLKREEGKARQETVCQGDGGQERNGGQRGQEAPGQGGGQDMAPGQREKQKTEHRHTQEGEGREMVSEPTKLISKTGVGT